MAAVAHPDPKVDAWIQRQLAKPGGRGPLPRPAQAVLSSVFGQPRQRSA